jgi:hypothetical protein
VICQRKRNASNEQTHYDSTSLDTDEWGPLEFRVDDKEAALNIMRVLIEHTDGVSNVDSYTKKEGKKLKKMVNGDD